ncbi:MAG: hypothetical protein SVU32_04180 [Candidatus Nanohaloarchaea archaeon]|nr:hypothetical protein [Candidatus Nanohaloarchaea archaeon]
MWDKAVPAFLVLLLIPAYIVAVYALPAPTNVSCGSGGDRGPGEKVGFCTRISISHTRSYYFGILRLPVQRGGINLDLANRLFAPLVILAAAAVWNRKKLYG